MGLVPRTAAVLRLLDRRRSTARTVPGLTLPQGDRLPALSERQPGTESPRKEPAPAPQLVRREVAAALRTPLGPEILCRALMSHDDPHDTGICRHCGMETR